MASSRFPDKPLKKICEIPMVGHVYFRSKMCKILNEVYVATCDEEIEGYITSIGGKVIMTANSHERASDRVAEAMIKIEKENRERVDIVVMIQGDEPMIYPSMIEEAVKSLCDDDNILVTNLMGKITTTEEFEDSNEVKVVVDKYNNALYFSREPIPSRKKGAKIVPMFKQICIISFRRDFLLNFNALDPTPLEIVESVDMMRILENGYKVKMVLTDAQTYSVDTPEDLAFVNSLMKDDALIKKYNQNG